MPLISKGHSITRRPIVVTGVLVFAGLFLAACGLFVLLRAKGSSSEPSDLLRNAHAPSVSPTAGVLAPNDVEVARVSVVRKGEPPPPLDEVERVLYLQVLAAETGRVVYGATARVGRTSGGHLLGRSDEDGLLQIVESALVAVARPDDVIVVRAPNLALHVIEPAHCSRSALAPTRIELRSAMDVEVIVLNDDRTPAGDVTVSVYAPAAPATIVSPEVTAPARIRSRRDSNVGARLTNFDRWSSPSNASGVAHFESVPRVEELEVVVRRRGRSRFHETLHVTAPPDGSPARLVCALTSGVRCEGRLTDDAHAPIAFQEIRLSRPDRADSDRETPGSVHWASRDPWATTTTDVAGRFRFDDVPEGLWLCGPALPPKSACGEPNSVPGAGFLFVAETAKQELWELVVPRGLAIRGTVVDEERRPIAAATVIARHASIEGLVQTKTDSSGRFCLGPILDVPYGVVATAPDFTTSAPSTIRPGEDVELALRTGHSLTLKLEDRSGAAQGIRAVSFRAGDLERTYALGGHSAEMSLPFLNEENHAVLVESASGGFASRDAVRVGARGRPLRFVAEPGGIIRVRPRSTPVRIRCTWRGITFHAENGALATERELACPVGEVELEASSVDGSTTRVVVMVEAGAVTVAEWPP